MNPRWSFPHTRFPIVLLKPLGHLSFRAINLTQIERLVKLKVSALRPPVAEHPPKAAPKTAQAAPTLKITTPKPTPALIHAPLEAIFEADSTDWPTATMEARSVTLAGTIIVLPPWANLPNSLR